MRKFETWCGIALLIAPLVARADPVEVVTRTSGTMSTDSVVLGWLGLPVPASVTSLPYDLTVRSTIDPADGSYEARPYLGMVTQTAGAGIDVTLALGSYHYHYAGTGHAQLDGYWDVYDQEVVFQLPGNPSVSVMVRNLGSLPDQNFNLNSPLYPPTIVDAPVSYSFGTISVFVQTDSPVPQNNGLVGESATYSVQLVPEPKESAMLAAGVLFLLAAATMRRGRRQAVADRGRRRIAIRACPPSAALRCGRARPAGWPGPLRLH